MSIQTNRKGQITFTGADARKAFDSIRCGATAEVLTGEKLPELDPKKKRVRIVNPAHPHTGETGHVTLNDNGTVTVKRLFGADMLEIELVDCPHGTSGCFVKQGDIELVP